MRVNEDGSAYFTVPAEQNIFFQALDENFMALQHMPTFINLMPDENRSCIGCHEHRKKAPRMARRPQSESAPQGSARLLGLLVLSGFAGIALEIAWFRKLHLTLGSESYSVALVLAAFMAGLGLGSFLFGRLADRMAPVVLYRRLELGIGLFGLASPFVLAASSVPYAVLRNGLHLEGKDPAGRAEEGNLFGFQRPDVAGHKLPSRLEPDQLPTPLRGRLSLAHQNPLTNVLLGGGVA